MPHLLRHAISTAKPFVMGLVGEPVYVQVLLSLPPFESQEVDGNGVLLEGARQGYKRR